MAVDGDVHYHLVGGGEVFVERDFHVGVAVAFLFVVLADYGLGAVDDVLRYLVAFHELQLLLYVVAVGFFHAEVVDFGDARLGAQSEFYPCFVAGRLQHLYLHLREQAVAHEALHGVGEVVAGDGHAVARLESGVAEHCGVVVVRCSADGDACYFIDTRERAVDDGRVEYRVGNLLCGCGY